ncbi:MAG: DUF6279 family lipoprotein [Pseudomonadota bacterium]
MLAFHYKASLRWLLLTSLVFLGACSSTTFVYNQLDTIVPWYVDDYVDLDREQREQLDAELEIFLAWHRQQELPRYVQLLDQVDTTLGTPVTTQEIADLYAEMEVAFARLEEESLVWLLDLGASLTDQQVEELLVYMQERQEEFKEEYLSRTDEEYREKVYDNLKDNFSDYMGRLDKQQRERLQLASQEMERTDALWLQERELWQQRIAEFLEREPGWQQRVRDAVAQRGETVSEEYREAYLHNLDVIFVAVADVLNSRTEKQDGRLRREMAGLRDDLETLIAQGRSKSAAPALAQASTESDRTTATAEP